MHSILIPLFLVLSFLACLAYMLRARDSRLSVMQLLLAGPMLFISPDKYFAKGRQSAPWRALAAWTLALIIAAIAAT